MIAVSEIVAPFGYVDAGDEHAVVACELNLEGGMNGIHRAEGRREMQRF